MLDERIYLLAGEYLLATLCLLSVSKVWMDHFDAVAGAKGRPPRGL
jgi:hypothetical protein